MRKRTALVRVIRCSVLALAAIAAPAAAPAAPDPGQLNPATNGLELILFEAPGCAYCPAFLRDVAPSYPSSRAGRSAPLRIVDVNDAAASAFRLKSPVTIVPTVVLVRDGVEIGRIPGYVGRANMHRILDTMLPD